MLNGETEFVKKRRAEMINKRFEESIKLAQSLGVPEDKILHNEEEIRRCLRIVGNNPPIPFRMIFLSYNAGKTILHQLEVHHVL